MALMESTDTNNNPLTAQHPTMTLLSGAVCVLSHSCRVVLMEKDVERNIEYVSIADNPARVGEFNPYLETPTLLDRDLVLYEASVIIEYLDERFPHPPLMPVDPISRAKTRLIIARLTRDWLRPIGNFNETAEFMLSAELKKSIHDGLLAISPLFANQPFFVNTEYTLADAYMTPLLWRLPALGISLPKQAAPLLEYAERMFKRPAFIKSLSPREIELR